ncbi:MAG: helix-turn-helix transcriptional regulator [Ketobacter sp.]|nr:helix-turn-helix transcriptional regulator [Ketobacter sp.]
MKIGTFIRMKRLAAGMTLQELYEKTPTKGQRAVGKHPGRSAIHKIEMQDYDLRWSQLQAIAGAFGQSAAEFLAEFEDQ